MVAYIGEKDIDEALKGIKEILIKAADERRSIRIDMDRELHQVPGDGKIDKYESTGQITIQIKTGLRNSMSYKEE